MQLHREKSGGASRTGECKVHRKQDQETETRQVSREGSILVTLLSPPQGFVLPSWLFHRTTIEFVSELLGLDSSSRTSLSLSPTIAHPNDFIHETIPCLESNRSSIAQRLNLCTGGILSLNWEEVNSSMGFCESYIPRYSKKIFF